MGRLLIETVACNEGDWYFAARQLQSDSLTWRDENRRMEKDVRTSWWEWKGSVPPTVREP